MKLPVDRSFCLLWVGDEASACCTPCCCLLLAVSTLAVVRASRAPTLSSAMPVPMANKAVWRQYCHKPVLHNSFDNNLQP
jgi:hypothetical protein